MSTKFGRWLAGARRFFAQPKTVRRAPRNCIESLRHLEQRLAPAIFTGGVTVASGDVNGDGALDLICGAGPGGSPLVKVYSGASGEIIQQFNAFESTFTGGVFVAAGDVNGDGKAEVIVGAGPSGTPRVRVFD